MTKENKELLLQDICARFPYGVKVQVADTTVELSHINIENGNGRKPYCFAFAFEPERVKPYLRPMLSMTEEELREYNHLYAERENNNEFDDIKQYSDLIDYLNAHHFDYRGLIEKGLAIEVTESNNPYK